VKFQFLTFNNLLYFSESERAERERKGDLDPHERVDGDRNQTAKFLAVKKVVLVSSWSFHITYQKNHLGSFHIRQVICFWKLL
jgi:hypothetical protein